MLNTLVHNQPVNKGLHWAMFVPTLVHNKIIHKGFQWAELNASVVTVYVYNGGPCVHHCKSVSRLREFNQTMSLFLSSWIADEAGTLIPFK